MQQFRKKLSKFDIRYFPFFYIWAVVIIIVSGYLVRNYREIEEYKQLTLWYENLEPSNLPPGKLSEFVTKAKEKLEDRVISNLKSSNTQKVPNDVNKKIISGQNLPQGDSVQWKIGKTKESLTVYYDYVSLNDFSGQQVNDSQIKKNDDKVFQLFTFITTKDIKDKLDSPKINKKNIEIDNLSIFSKSVMNYLANDDKYSESIPYLRINNIYITNLKTGFMISYPLTNSGYRPIDFKTRPWFKATQNNYGANFKSSTSDSNQSGITGVYIDISSESRKNPNVIRTLYYRFNDERGEEYILCIDLFFDKSSQFSSVLNHRDLVEQYIKAGLDIEPSDNPWIYLLLYSFLMALILFLGYEIKVKYILLRIFNFNRNNFLKISLKRDIAKTHYADANTGKIEITIKGITGQKNESQVSTEAQWKADFNQLQASVGMSRISTHQQEFTYGYQLSNSYNLDITQSNLKYRCVETWDVILSAPIINQTIGHFVVTWDAKDSESLEELIEIKSVYWEKEYENYLNSIKTQLREHLLISDAGELVPVIDTNYSRHQNIPELINQTESLKKSLHNSLYLKQGRIAFSDINTLTQLYQHNGVEVKAICTLNFLTKLLDNKQLEEFFQVTVQERYFRESTQNQFRDFYNNISDDNVKYVLKSSSNFKIMVYNQPNANNIINSQDDFCVISVEGTPKFVVYSFTDDRYQNIGWISWREVDVKFYNELYKCQTETQGEIKTIVNYLNKS